MVRASFCPVGSPEKRLHSVIPKSSAQYLACLSLNCSILIIETALWEANIVVCFKEKKKPQMKVEGQNFAPSTDQFVHSFRSFHINCAIESWFSFWDATPQDFPAEPSGLPTPGSSRASRWFWLDRHQTSRLTIPFMLTCIRARTHGGVCNSGQNSICLLRLLIHEAGLSLDTEPETRGVACRETYYLPASLHSSTASTGKYLTCDKFLH